MASWKDGAAYAPVERPDGFASPIAAPLSEGEPYRATTAGAVARPLTFDAQPQAPLDSLSVDTTQTRDPKESFSVTSMLLSEAPVGGGPRNPQQPFTVSSSAATGEDPPPPTGAPLAPPPHWPPPNGRPGAPQVRSPQGGASLTLISIASGACAMGFLLPVTAPFMLVIAGALTFRTKARTANMCWISLGTGALAIVWQTATGALNEPNWLWAVFALSMAVAFLIAGLRNPG